jgi:N-acetylmuramoyl-L-alanine amidase
VVQTPRPNKGGGKMKKAKLSLLSFAVFASSLTFGGGIKADAASLKEVNAYSLTVRSGPSSHYKAVDWLKQGTDVTVISSTSGWDYIQYGNQKGYVYDKYLRTVKTNVATPASSSGTSASVKTHSLTLRQSSSASSKALDYLMQGDKVQILGYSGNWAKVSVNGKTGYVDKSYLSISATSTSPSTSTSYAAVNTYSLTVRQSASSSSKAIDYLMKGAKVQVLSTSGNWTKVSVNGKTGYVYKTYLTAATSTTPSTPTPVPTPTPSVTTYTKYVTSTDGLNVRASRDWNSTKLGTVPYRGKVTLSNVTNGWGYVVYGNLKGYVNVSYLSDTQPSVSIPTNPTTPPVVSGNLSGKTVVLDPGHGGKFNGAQGIVIEETVNLQISLKVRAKLQAQGANVLMTRTTDTACTPYGTYNQDLLCRPALATKNHANVFVSIHANSGASSASGAETFWYNSGRGDQRLSSYIMNELKTTGGMKSRSYKFGNLSVLRNSTVPSTLVETGFVTNASDAAKLGSSSYQDKIAQAIANGITQYLK